MRDGARVAVVGAGNGDDLPLGALARRAARVDLVDLDAAAARRARRRLVAGRRRVRVLGEDVTLGAADAVVARALGAAAPPRLPAPVPVGDGPYDVVVADAVLTQLLYPALLDTGLPGAAIDDVLLRDGQALTDAVVARLLASTAPGGVVVLVHDALGWWEGHPQPFALGDVLAAAGHGPDAALALVRRGRPPYGCDPHAALRRAGAELLATELWRWPFAAGVDYLVCGLVARGRRASELDCGA
ncbi:MAG: hypothetical protein QOH43_1989 [Solirubrobacteraceae bacterium]|nr:hypothetical protein [Solirubrobacteraceae bacterium]